MRRKGNEVCPLFLSQLSHLLSLTHNLSYIVSSLVRTWVSWKCLDFDNRDIPMHSTTTRLRYKVLDGVE